MGPCHHYMAGPQVAVEERPPIWRIAANILNNQSRTADKGWSYSLGIGRNANNSSLFKMYFVTKYSQTKPRSWTDTVLRPNEREGDRRFGAWSVGSLCRAAGALTAAAAARELASGCGVWGYGLDRAGSGQGQVAGTCECGNEPSDSIKGGEFLD